VVQAFSLQLQPERLHHKRPIVHGQSGQGKAGTTERIAMTITSPEFLSRWHRGRITYLSVKTNIQSITIMSALVCMAMICLANTPSKGAVGSADRGVSQRSEPSAPWPRFRGPNGSGLGEAQIPSQWTDADYNWKTKLPGGGNSSPTVWGDRIFLTCASDNTGEHQVVCLNAGDGSIRWTRTYPSSTFSHNAYNSYASSTPAVDEKNVYVCWSTPEELTLLALDHDGKDLWQKGLGPFISQHGGGQSPIVYQNRVIIGDDQEGPASFLFAFDRDTGAEVWKAARKPSNKFAPATPCVFQPKDGPPQLIFLNKSQGFTGIDPTDGHTIWELLPKLFNARPVASPYTADGLLLGSCGDGPVGHDFAAVRPSDDGKSATVAYEFRKVSPYVPTSIVKNGLLFYVTDNGIMSCLHVDTGELVWKERLDDNFYGSFVCAGNKLIILSKESNAYVIAASDKFELLGRNPLKLEEEGAKVPALSTTPAIANGRIYIRTYNHLVSLGGKR
jgi:outer membrane protein assembly factor BamB